MHSHHIQRQLSQQQPENTSRQGTHYLVNATTSPGKKMDKLSLNRSKLTQLEAFYLAHQTLSSRTRHFQGWLGQSLLGELPDNTPIRGEEAQVGMHLQRGSTMSFPAQWPHAGTWMGVAACRWPVVPWSGRVSHLKPEQGVGGGGQLCPESSGRAQGGSPGQEHYYLPFLRRR